MSVLSELVKDFDIPEMVQVRQKFNRDKLGDIPGAVRAAVLESNGLGPYQRRTVDCSCSREPGNCPMRLLSTVS